MNRRISISVLIAILSVLFGCVDAEMEDEQLLPSLMQATDEEYNPLDFLGNLSSNKMGKTLVDFAKMSITKGIITFQHDGTLRKDMMVYVGNGIIYYNLGTRWAEQLAFHEVFHILQCGNEPKYILNNEVEAYLAQYIYCKYRGKEKEFKTPHRLLTDTIKKLAGTINMYTGEPIRLGMFKVHYDLTSSMRTPKIIRE